METQPVLPLKIEHQAAFSPSATKLWFGLGAVHLQQRLPGLFRSSPKLLILLNAVLTPQNPLLIVIPFIL